MSSHHKIGQKRGRTSRPRIVLLLDLDCFYAQCETVRLGLDKSLPLCLLQWNSALAVNYPARAYGIKRGDGFDEISKKSQGQCVSLHLPVISVEDITASSASAPAAAAAAQDGDGGHHAGEEDLAGGGISELVQSYNATYNLPAETRAELFQKEKDVMRHPHEGKASLERYRLASARIFSVITEALTANVGKGKFVLERASIDEIFLDVSDHCYNAAVPAWKEDEIEGLTDLTDATSKETVVFGSNTKQTIGEYGSNGDGGDHDDDDDDEASALRRGCIVAKGVRSAVFSSLGFTMSAGVAINKTIAKLGATYGKPDGQAVVFPELIPKLMEETPIRKCRNMGGKVGKAVLSLLPKDEDRMGSIARLLSINDLAQKLGRETAQRVFNVARGIDGEAVQETKGALTKSITAFKSFGAAYLEGMDKWTRLLATDVVARVEQDSKRNQRYPKSCNIQYTFSSGLGGNERTTRSARIPFPKASETEQRLEQLISKVTDALAKRDDFPIHRLGLSAIDFEAQSRNGAIDAFFAKQASPKSKKRRSEDAQADKITAVKKVSTQSSTSINEEAPTTEVASPKSEAVSFSYDADLEYARRLQATLNESASIAPRSEDSQQPQRESKSSEDPDLEYARRLQASFDTEERMLSALDRSGGGSGGNGGAKGTKRQKPSSFSGLRKNGNGGDSVVAAPSSKMKIDNFFSVKKKK